MSSRNLVMTRRTGPAPLTTMRLRVHAIQRVAESAVALTLKDVEGGELPAWEPGAHLDVRVTPQIERQYSLCGDPADRTSYRVAVLREPTSRGGSAFVYFAMRTGDVLDVRGPRNNFELSAAPSYRFVAGGIGITPILPMIKRADELNADWRLLYGGRRRSAMSFLGELERYGDRVRVAPQDEQGLLDLDVALDDVDSETLIYCCGPEALLQVMEQRCAALPPGTLRIERFSPKAERAAASVAERPFEVECVQSGVTVEVPSGVTILDALQAAGVKVDSSCEEGVCGTCETRVLEGQVDHRDSLLNDAERRESRVMMICCSRALGERLVLDL